MRPQGTTSANTVLAIRDRYFAPSALAPFADDMALRLSCFSIGPLLETSAGSGTLTQAVASGMSAGIGVVATDPDAEVVEYASKKPGMARVGWQHADPAALPFADATFGIVTSQFGIVTMPDRVQAFREARRVMKPGSRFVFSVPTHLRHNSVADCVQGAVEDLFPVDPPGFVGRILHYADAQTIDNDLTKAGFTDTIYTVVNLPYVAASARNVTIGYCLGTPLRLELEARVPGEAERVAQAMVAAVERRFGRGPIEARMQAQMTSAAG